jgi:citrate synthase
MEGSIPADAKYAITSIIVWASPFMALLSLWFITRFVKSHDQFREKTTESIAAFGAACAEASEKSKKTVTEFQAEVGQKMLEFEREAVKAIGSIVRTEHAVEHLALGLETLSKRTDDQNKTHFETKQRLDAQLKTMGKIAEIEADHRARIKKLEAEVTDVKKIREELTVVTTKKKS